MIINITLCLLLHFSIFYCVKYLRWLWIATIVFFIGYFINVYLQNGFDSVLFASGIAILASGIGFLNKK